MNSKVFNVFDMSKVSKISDMFKVSEMFIMSNVSSPVCHVASMCGKLPREKLVLLEFCLAG